MTKLTKKYFMRLWKAILEHEEVLIDARKENKY